MQRFRELRPGICLMQSIQNKKENFPFDLNCTSYYNYTEYVFH